MDEATEAISASDAACRWLAHRLKSARLRGGRGEVERSVWPVAVVVVDEDTEYLFEVATAEDQEPVEAFRANGADAQRRRLPSGPGQGCG